MSHQMLDSPRSEAIHGAAAIRPRSRQISNPSTMRVEDHPVFALLGAATQDRLLGSGQARPVPTGSPLEINGCVTFVLEGLLGTVCRTSDVCVSLAGAGAVIGLESGFDTPRAGHVVALAPSQVYAAPAAVLIEGLGRSRVLELCMRHSLGRLHAMETEAACNAAHLVPQRLAKWLIRLHQANQERDIHLTQADLARLLGVQRTSINAAGRHLQLIGAARFTRGRIVVRDVDALIAAACSCSI